MVHSVMCTQFEPRLTLQIGTLANAFAKEERMRRGECGLSGPSDTVVLWRVYLPSEPFARYYDDDDDDEGD